MNPSTRALILDKSHRILITEGGRLAGAGFSDLAELKEAFRALDLPLPGPVGVDPPRFAFLVQGEPLAPLGYKWVPIQKAPESLGHWDLYISLLLGGFDPGTRSIDVFHFGNTPYMAAQLAHLVVKGRKRLTAGSAVAMEKTGTAVPFAGLLSVVTDGYGVPLCLIRTKSVERLRFADVSAEMAFEEGEGDLSLRDWREGHWEYFTREATQYGFEFTEQNEILVEQFEVVRVLAAVIQHRQIPVPSP